MDPYEVWRSAILEPFVKAYRAAYARYERRFRETNRKIGYLSKGKGFFHLTPKQRDLVDEYFEREDRALLDFYKAKEIYKNADAKLTISEYIARRSEVTT